MESKPQFDIVEKVPSWATCYFAYGDDSGLSKEDRDQADAWEKSLNDGGKFLVAPVDGTESEFEPYPAFGLASGTVDWTIEIKQEK